MAIWVQGRRGRNAHGGPDPAVENGDEHRYQDQEAKKEEEEMGKKKPQVEEQNNPNGAPGHMNDSLLAQSNKIRDLVIKAEANDVMARYEIAVAIRDLRDAARPRVPLTSNIPLTKLNNNVQIPQVRQ
jgi:hypothetical protein